MKPAINDQSLQKKLQVQLESATADELAGLVRGINEILRNRRQITGKYAGAVMGEYPDRYIDGGIPIYTWGIDVTSGHVGRTEDRNKAVEIVQRIDDFLNGLRKELADE